MQHNSILTIRAYILIGILIFIAVASRVYADPTTNAPSVTLAWDRVQDASVVGYKVYWGAASRQYTNSVTINDSAVTTASVTNLTRGVLYFFAATAFKPGLESDYSSEVTYQTLTIPLPPSNLTIKQETP